MEKIKLTQYSHGSGCGCKIAPAELERILSGQKISTPIPQLLVGNQTNDDAAVWDLGNGSSLISTVDFFLPVVDDAYDFGRIAAANALSDVYAMGGKPLLANALLGWPIDKLPSELASEVLRGAKDMCDSVHVPVAGGHSINSSDPIFGLAVNGMVNTISLKRNSTAQAGDAIYLTKPLGSGVMATAIKRGVAHQEHVLEAISWMCKLNTIGAQLSALTGVHALTDVTGFGLAGHLLEMCGGAGLNARIQFSQVPVLPFLDGYLSANCIPDNTYRNWNSWEKKVNGITDMRSFQILNDPQTSGGLLIAVDAGQAAQLEVQLKLHGLPVCCIGNFESFNTEPYISVVV